MGEYKHTATYDQNQVALVKEVTELKKEVANLKEIVERLRGEIYYTRRGV